MITYSIIRKTQLEGTNRIDAEYYQPVYLELLEALKSNKLVLLSSVARKITQGPNPIFVDAGKICLNGRNIKNYRIDKNQPNYVSDEEYKKYLNFKVQKNDILITLKGLGSIGKTGYVFDDIDAIFSRDIGLIRTNEKSEFLYAFLLSKYGSFQIERSTTGGTGQLTLATSYIKQIQIPIFNSENLFSISSLVRESESQHFSSINLYKEAENLLLEELELTDYQIQEDLSYIVNFSDIKSANRIDAEYFQPFYFKILDKITSKSNTLKLTDIFAFTRGIFISPEFYTNNKTPKPYIRIKELSEKGLLNEDEIIYINDKYNSRVKDELQENDLVLAIIGDTIGKTSRINKFLAGGFCSNNTGRLRLKLETRNKFIPEYLEILFQSLVIRSQIEKKKAQTGQPKINDNEIQQIIIPIIKLQVQQKIADLVKKSHEARKKSKELLEEAKKQVEEMIEKGQN